MKLFRLVILTVLFVPTIAGAHSPVAYVIPQDEAIIKESPATMEIAFTGPSKLIKVRLYRLEPNEGASLVSGLFGEARQEEITLSDVQFMEENKRHLIGLPRLTDGMYEATWRAISEDGHTIKGVFSFEISPNGTNLVAAEDQSFKGVGVVMRIRGTKLTIRHGPIADLIPAMTMEYEVPDKAVLKELKKGDQVSFEINKNLEITNFVD